MKDVYADPFACSTLTRRIEETRYVLLTDLDGTNDGTEEDRHVTDTLARSLGGLVFVSARAPEQQMSDRRYARSVERFGFDRPRSTKPISVYRHQTDPDAICSFGEAPWLLQTDGAFACDASFAQLSGMKDWYRQVRLALHRLDADRKIDAALASFEHPENFTNGTADVMRLSYRIQLNFYGPDAGTQLKEILDRITSSMIMFDSPKNVRFFYEPGHSGRQTLYLTPRYAPKGRTANFVVTKAAMAAGVPLSELDIDAAGDEPTDFSLLSALPDARSFRFLLSGGSRLCPHFTMGDPAFGTPYNGFPTAPYCRRLTQTRTPGVYELSLPGRERPVTFVVGDLAYPERIGTQSVKAFLAER
jgi:hypothetical protein